MLFHFKFSTFLYWVLLLFVVRYVWCMSHLCNGTYLLMLCLWIQGNSMCWKHAENQIYCVHHWDCILILEIKSFIFLYVKLWSLEVFNLFLVRKQPVRTHEKSVRTQKCTDARQDVILCTYFPQLFKYIRDCTSMECPFCVLKSVYKDECIFRTVVEIKYMTELLWVSRILQVNSGSLTHPWWNKWSG